MTASSGRRPRGSGSARLQPVCWQRLALLLLAGCRADMQNQPYQRPLVESDFYADHRSARPIVAGTVARGHLDADTYFYTGKIGSNDGDYLPFPVTAEVLARGQQRFNIYCSPCHSELGDGNGMIVQRGLQTSAVVSHRPPAQGADRLLLRRDDQRLWRHARLRGAGPAGRPLGDRRLHSRAAIEPARYRSGCARGNADCHDSAAGCSWSARRMTRRAPAAAASTPPIRRQPPQAKGGAQKQ